MYRVRTAQDYAYEWIDTLTMALTTSHSVNGFKTKGDR